MKLIIDQKVVLGLVLFFVLGLIFLQQLYVVQMANSFKNELDILHDIIKNQQKTN